MDRLEKIGTKVYRTDENGEISIVIDKKGKITQVNKLIK